MKPTPETSPPSRPPLSPPPSPEPFESPSSRRNRVSRFSGVPLALTVGAGAALGAGARFLVSSAVRSDLSATTLINLLGCLIFGILIVTLSNRPACLAFAGTGICGGFTTFSAFALLLADGASTSPVALTVVALLHLAGCPLAYLAGSAAAKAMRHIETPDQGESREDLGAVR